MRTNFFCTSFLNTFRGPGHPGKIPRTSQIPPFETQGRQTFEGGHELFGHHPFARKTPTPPGGLRTQKVNLCDLFSCLTCAGIAQTLTFAEAPRRALYGPIQVLSYQSLGTSPPLTEVPSGPRCRKSLENVSWGLLGDAPEQFKSRYV